MPAVVRQDAAARAAADTFQIIEEFVMEKNDSHGRHGGNRGSGDVRDDNDPDRVVNTDVDSQANNRNENKGGRNGPQ